MVREDDGEGAEDVGLGGLSAFVDEEEAKVGWRRVEGDGGVDSGEDVSFQAAEFFVRASSFEEN